MWVSVCMTNCLNGKPISLKYITNSDVRCTYKITHMYVSMINTSIAHKHTHTNNHGHILIWCVTSPVPVSACILAANSRLHHMHHLFSLFSLLLFSGPCPQRPPQFIFGKRSDQCYKNQMNFDTRWIILHTDSLFELYSLSLVCD